MYDMNDLRLPLPNPEDWITRAGAAELLGISPRQVSRVIVAGRLGAYRPRGATTEQKPALLWYPEVVRYAEARRLVTTGEVSRA